MLTAARVSHPGAKECGGGEENHIELKKSSKGEMKTLGEKRGECVCDTNTRYNERQEGALGVKP